MTNSFLSYLAAFIFLLPGLTTAQTQPEHHLTPKASLENAVFLPDQHKMTAEIRRSAGDANQLGLTYYDDRDCSIWSRIYPELGEVAPGMILTENNGKPVLHFTANRLVYAVDIDKETGNLMDLNGLGTGRLLAANYWGGYLYIATSSQKCISIKKLNGCLKSVFQLNFGNTSPADPFATLSVLPNGDVFFSFGGEFGIVDGRKKTVKRRWRYSGLCIYQALFLPEKNLLVLAGREKSKLFGPENDQGYIAFLNPAKLDDVIWTRQFGSETKDEQIVKLIELPENKIGALLKSANDLVWLEIDCVSQKEVNTRKIQSEAGNIRILDIKSAETNPGQIQLLYTDDTCGAGLFKAAII